KILKELEELKNPRPKDEAYTGTDPSRTGRAIALFVLEWLKSKGQEGLIADNEAEAARVLGRITGYTEKSMRDAIRFAREGARDTKTRETVARWTDECFLKRGPKPRAEKMR